MADYLPRTVDPLLEELMTDHPAVLVVGPRACGKTTTARRHSAGRLRLDRPSDAAAVRADPDAAVAAGPFPLLVDEWQLVPEVLAAVKRAVDDHEGHGRFLVTGSSQADLTSAGWPATGRLVRVAMFGLSERELEQRTSSRPLIDRLADGSAGPTPPTADAPDVRDYVFRALRGALPEAALAGGERSRRRWLASYVDQMVARDIPLAGAARDPVRLRRYLQALAASSGGMPTVATLVEAAGIDRQTAVVYDGLLEQLLITERLPAWSTNRLNRLVRLPKRHLVDPALVGPLLGVDSRAVLRDGDLLGRVLESFVVAQLRVECAVSEFFPRLFHVRDANGRHEVDIVVELADGRVLGIEVKADAAPGRDSVRHLYWLKEALGPRFAAGVVLHTGPRGFRIGGEMLALPISSLWSEDVPAGTSTGRR